MGTRGAIGWKIDGKFYSIYKQFDCYPSGLGRDVCTFLSEVKDFGYLKRRLMECDKEVVGMNTTDSEFHLTGKRKWDRNEGLGYLKALYNDSIDHIFITDHNFLRDSLYCEYAYVIDFDRMLLLFFKGNSVTENDRKESPFPSEWWDNPLVYGKNKWYPVKYIDYYGIKGVTFQDFIISSKEEENEKLRDKIEILENRIEALGEKLGEPKEE